MTSALPATPASAGERPTILVVDDTPANLSLLANLLKEQYRVKIANNGNKALDLAFATPPDLILLDIMMPEIDGYEVCRRLQAHPATARVPVIFLTAKNETEDEELGFSVGAVDFIHKPISPPIVAARVNTHLQIKKWHDCLQEKNEQLHAASERVQEELDLARNMQQAILPQQFPDDGYCSVHAAMFPARELGGDFYDCFRLMDGRYGVLIADVSGKGVGAAFFMAVSRTVLMDLAITGSAPSEVFAKANDMLCDRNPMELFVTVGYAIYNPADGQLVYASAGHHPPLLRRASGLVESLQCPMDIALGIMPGMDYADNHANLAPGDTLLLYTDGVTEAFAANGEAYGDARLHAWFENIQPDGAASPVVDGLVSHVAAFVNGAEASDDLTCLVLCRK